MLRLCYNNRKLQFEGARHMDINDYKKYEPVFGSWHITKAIGRGSFGSVFEIQRTEFDTTYSSALKIISIPQDGEEIRKMELEGMSEDAIKRYYDNVVRDIVNELVIMSVLKGNSNIVSYEDHTVIRHEDGIGFDILIRMELLTSLIQYRGEHQMTQQDVAKLGSDLCKALELCEQNHIIHRDVKPENIFVASSGNYKLGDFGIARTIEKTSGDLSRKGTYSYMAPEIYRGEPYGTTVDLYSLGVVMYSLLNGNRAPFLPPMPAEITHNEKENALVRRVRGEKIPPLAGVDKSLMNIILKACAFHAGDRFSSASEMKNALDHYCKGETEDTELTEDYVSSPDGDETTVLEQAQGAAYRMNPQPSYGQQQPFGQQYAQPPYDPTPKYPNPQFVPPYDPRRGPGNTKSRRWIPILVIAILLALLCAIGTFFLLQKLLGDDDSDSSGQDGAAETTTTEQAGETLPGYIPTDAAEFNGHHYKLYNRSGTWTDAKSECESENGHLVTITSSEEQSFIEELIEENRSDDMYHFWLGGTDHDRATGDFIWITGEDLTFNNYEPDQPNNIDGQDYLEIQATLGDNGDEEYMTWTDVPDNGVCPGFEEEPEYNSTPYYGYICEWDE